MAAQSLIRDIPPARYREAVASTWPPLSSETHGCFTFRNGAGGGKRVSATSMTGGLPSEIALDSAISKMQRAGARPLFSLSPDQNALDAALEARGFEICDPTLIYAAPVADLAHLAPPGIAVLPADRPLAIQREIWLNDGIGPARIAVMERARGAKCYLLARHNDRTVGTGFVASDGEIAMLHALFVSQDARAQGIGRNITTGAARWAVAQQATILALAVTEANAPARALYEKLGMTAVTRYHYRQLTE